MISIRDLARFGALALLVALALGCGEQRVVESTAPAEEAPASAEGEAAGGDDSQLPEGHPPIGGASSPRAPMVPGPPPGSGQGNTALTWDVPEDWSAVPPESSMRRAQYVVPGPGGDAELVVFYFGPGQGGDALSNAQRWASQFRDEQGAPVGEDAMSISETRSAEGVSVTLVEVRGTYQEGGMMMTGQPAETAQPSSMLLGAIAEGPDANWFFKLTGPEETVEAAHPEFEALVASLRPGASSA